MVTFIFSHCSSPQK